MANYAQEISRLELEIDKARASQMDVAVPSDFKRSFAHLMRARANYAADKKSDQVAVEILITQQSLAEVKRKFACRRDRLERVLRARERVQYEVHRCRWSESSILRAMIHLDDSLKSYIELLGTRCLEEPSSDSFWVEVGESYVELIGKAMKTREVVCQPSVKSS